MSEFRQALEDCKAAISFNDKFPRAYKRMIRCYLSLGELEVFGFHFYDIESKGNLNKTTCARPQGS